MSTSGRVLLLLIVAALSGGTACRADRPALDAPRAGADGEDLLVAALRALPVRTQPRDPAVEQLGQRFEAMFRSRPDTAAAAPALVRDERELRGKIVLDALARADTVQSAAALAAVVIDASAPAGARRYALDRLRSWGDDLPLPHTGDTPDVRSRRVARR